MIKWKGRIYSTACILLGAAVLIIQGAQFRPEPHFAFLTYLGAAAVLSLFSFRIPIGTRQLSGGLLFILLGNMELTLAEVLIVGCVGAFGSALREAKFKPRIGDLAYQLGSEAIGIALAYHAFALIPFVRLNPLFPAALLASSLALFGNYALGAAILRPDDTPLPVYYQSRVRGLLPLFIGTSYLACLIHIASVQMDIPAAAAAVPIVLVMNQGYRFYLKSKNRDRQHEIDMEAAQLRTIEAIAIALEAKDDSSQLYLRRVQVSSVEIGREMGLSEIELKALQAAALLHDIGKLAIPEHIISKPGQLTAEEFEKMKTHVLVGEEILERMQLPYPVAPIVRNHHEKWDGTGYPAGLKGEQIPTAARILSAVDCFAALASDRPYRKAFTLDEAMDTVAKEAGKSFDPRITEILQRRYLELDQITKEQIHRSGQTRIQAPSALERKPFDAKSIENLAAAIRRVDFASRDRFPDSIASASKEDQLLRELSGDLGSTLGLEETFTAVDRCARRIVPHDTIGIFLCKGGNLSPAYIRGADRGMFSLKEFAAGQGISGRVFQSQTAILNGDGADEANYQPDEAFHGPQSALSVPLNGVSDQVGVLTLYSARYEAFTREHLRILQSLSSKVATAIENALRYNSAQNLATTDFLTGLPNSRSLSIHLAQELARASRDRSKIAVMVCDLDGFKLVNDTFGHLTGNKVLQLVATGLRETCRDSDYTARLGGDEFVIVLPGFNPDSFPAQASRFRSVAEDAGMRACGQPILSMSMGVALYPIDGATAEVLLAKADQRMYEVKKERKGRSRDAASVQKAGA